MERKQTLLAASRALTKAEIEHYQAHGWAKLDQLVSPQTVAYLLSVLRMARGTTGDRGAPPRGAGIPFFLPDHLGGGYYDEVLHPLHKMLGRNAEALLDRGNDIGMRYFDSIFLTKLPSQKQELSGTGRTDFHQDYPDWKLDRAGGMVFWIALGDYGPESGTMSFLSGSQRKGPLGSLVTWMATGRTINDLYPKLSADCPLTQAMTYKAGDATVHSDLTLHGAGLNLTGQPRQSYTVIYTLADACWTGAPALNRYEASVKAGLRPMDILDDANFPRVVD